MTIFLTGCTVPPDLLDGSANLTYIPGVVQTIVVETARVAWTQTAAGLSSSLTETFTPIPIDTPSLMPPPMPIVISPVPSSTVPSYSLPTETALASGRRCMLVSQVPANGSHFPARRRFEAGWVVKNTGSVPWGAGNVDYAYISGDEFHRESLYDLGSNVPVGGSVELTVSMVAPKGSGTWTTIWSLRQGREEFCHVQLTIIVP